MAKKSKSSNMAMIVIIVVAVIVIAGVAYYMWPKSSETFNGGFDPSTRGSILGIGPTQEGFCANCQ